MLDFRSDTVTQPTTDMRACMLEAPLGDDVYQDDPSVNALQEKVATLLGKEAALFVPSGTMANQIAIHLHTRPGSTVLTETGAHIFVYEAGAAASLSGVQFDFVSADEWEQPGVVASMVREEGLHNATTTLLSIENTHNGGGGRPIPTGLLQRLTDEARHLGLRTHCDGARLWNAAVATGANEAELAAGFDSVSVCFSKGLGAPVGSALVGGREFIERARKVRKRWGGGMRQTGMLAAAASYALDHHRARLADDHRRVAALRDGLRTMGTETFAFRCPEQPTNILFFRPRKHDAQNMYQALAAAGIKVNPPHKGWLRLVTHLHIDDAAVARTLDVLTKAVKT